MTKKYSKIVQYHDTLHPKVWANNRLDSKIQSRLLKVARLFVNNLNVKNFKIIDVVLTGSMANYNYNKFSDFDLHIITDYSALNCSDLAGEFYQAKKSLWNMVHDITIHGHDVELYVEDVNDPPVASGMYSILKDKWIAEPVKKRPDIDSNSVDRKAESVVNTIQRVLSDNNRRDIKRTLNRLRKMRRAGLAKAGEYSVENLVFKIVRNLGYISELQNALRTSHDSKLSIVNEVKMSPTALSKFIKSEGGQSMVAGFEAELIFPEQRLSWDYETVTTTQMRMKRVEDTTIRNSTEFAEFFRQHGYNSDFSDEDFSEMFDYYIQIDSKLTVKDLIKSFRVDHNIKERNKDLMTDIAMNADQINSIMQFDSILWNSHPDQEPLIFDEDSSSADDIIKALDDFENSDRSKEFKAYYFNMLSTMLKQALKTNQNIFKNTIRALQKEAKTLIIHQLERGVYASTMSFVFIELEDYPIPNLKWRELEWPSVLTETEVDSQKLYTPLLELFLEETNGFGYPAEIYAEGDDKYTKWSFEQDGSLPKDTGFEIVSPAMPIQKTLEILPKFFEWVHANGGTTSIKTGFHMSVSTPDYSPEKLDYMKMALFLGDRHVLDSFNRYTNTFTVSAFERITNAELYGPSELSGGTLSNVEKAFELIRSSLHKASKAIVGDVLSVDKYTSINPHQKYVEIRSAGNAGYFDDPIKLQNTLSRYAYALYLAMNEDAETREYAKKLYQFLSSIVFFR